MAGRIQAGRNPEQSFLMRTMGAVASGVVSAACLYGGGTWLDDGNLKGAIMTIGGLVGLGCVGLAIPLANEGMKAVAASGDRLLNRTIHLRTVGGSLISGLVHAAVATMLVYPYDFSLPAMALAGSAGFLIGFGRGVCSKTAPAQRRLLPAHAAPAPAAPHPAARLRINPPPPRQRPIAQQGTTEYMADFEDGQPFSFKVEGNRYRATSVSGAFLGLKDTVDQHHFTSPEERVRCLVGLLQEVLIGKILSSDTLRRVLVGEIDRGRWNPDLSTTRREDCQAAEWQMTYGSINCGDMHIELGHILVSAVHAIREKEAAQRELRARRRVSVGGAGTGRVHSSHRRERMGRHSAANGRREAHRGGARVHFGGVPNDSGSEQDYSDSEQDYLSSEQDYSDSE